MSLRPVDELLEESRRIILERGDAVRRYRRADAMWLAACRDLHDTPPDQVTDDQRWAVVAGAFRTYDLGREVEQLNEQMAPALRALALTEADDVF